MKTIFSVVEKEDGTSQKLAILWVIICIYRIVVILNYSQFPSIWTFSFWLAQIITSAKSYHHIWNKPINKWKKIWTRVKCQKIISCQIVAKQRNDTFSQKKIILHSTSKTIVTIWKWTIVWKLTLTLIFCKNCNPSKEKHDSISGVAFNKTKVVGIIAQKVVKTNDRVFFGEKRRR